MPNQDLNRTDIRILEEAIRREETAISNLRRAPRQQGFEDECRIADEIKNREAVVKAYRRLAAISRGRQNQAENFQPAQAVITTLNLKGFY